MSKDFKIVIDNFNKYHKDILRYLNDHKELSNFDLFTKVQFREEDKLNAMRTLANFMHMGGYITEQEYMSIHEKLLEIIGDIRTLQHRPNEL